VILDAVMAVVEVEAMVAQGTQQAVQAEFLAGEVARVEEMAALALVMVEALAVKAR